MEQTDLHTHGTPARLAFADHMDRIVAGDRAPSSPEGAEMLTGVDPPLDGTVVLLAPADCRRPSVLITRGARRERT
jgi:hypothetical protein